MPRFAANLTMLFTEWLFLDRFAAARDAGFAAVEYLFPYDHSPETVAKALERSGLQQVLFNAPPGDWARGERGLASVPGRQDEFRASLHTALTYAAATQTRQLHVMAGIGGTFECYRRSITFACALAAPHNINILIEPLNGRDMPGYLLSDFPTAETIIRELALPNLKLQFDIYHRQIIHGDVLQGLNGLMPLIGHVQVASVPLRQEPCTGELDDARIFAELDALGYEGYVGCEYRPANGTLAGLSWRDSVSARLQSHPSTGH